MPEYKLKTNTKSEYGKRMVFDDHDRQMMERRFLLTSVIRKALDDETFRIFYQPIYSFRNQSYTKAEALLRLYDENLGWITPERIPSDCRGTGPDSRSRAVRSGIMSAENWSTGKRKACRLSEYISMYRPSSFQKTAFSPVLWKLSTVTGSTLPRLSWK